MDRTVATGIICVFFISFIYLLFVAFTGLFYEPDTGLVEMLDEQAEQDMNSDYYDSWSEQKSNTEDTWGLTGVLLIGVLIFVIVIIAFRHKRKVDSE